MYRLFLMPKTIGLWRRVLYSLALASLEALIAVLSVLGGLPILIDPSSVAPTSITALLPHWMVRTWGAGLVLGGVTSLWGIVGDQYRIEQIGCVTLASVTFTYALALLPFLPASLLIMFTYVLFSIALMARYWVLGKVIKIIKDVRRSTLEREVS